jgi:hypothetical protein
MVGNFVPVAHPTNRIMFDNSILAVRKLTGTSSDIYVNISDDSISTAWKLIGKLSDEHIHIYINMPDDSISAAWKLR